MLWHAWRDVKAFARPFSRRLRLPFVAKQKVLCSNDPVNQDVFIALGSNQGDRELNLLRGVAELGKLPGTNITALSSFYDTEPVGPVPQDNFLNAALRMATAIPSGELLAAMLNIETELFARVRLVPWGPRRLDLDLLFYGSEIHDRPDLILPHPRLHERRFVLQPLAEIAPEFVHPLLGQSIAQILAQLQSTEQVARML